jgi:hypothetical protein
MAKSRAKSAQSWYQAAVELLVREGKTLPQVVLQLDLPILLQEAEAHFHTDLFQKLFRLEVAKFARELADDPKLHNKRVVVGKLIRAADALIAKGVEDKAAEILHKICKVEGWDKSSDVTNVFGGLSQKELDAIKQKLSPVETPTSELAN